MVIGVREVVFFGEVVFKGLFVIQQIICMYIYISGSIDLVGFKIKGMKLTWKVWKDGGVMGQRVRGICMKFIFLNYKKVNLVIFSEVIIELYQVRIRGILFLRKEIFYYFYVIFILIWGS